MMMRVEKRRLRAQKKRRIGSLLCFPPSREDHFAICGTSLKVRLLQRQGSPRLLIVLLPFYTTIKPKAAAGMKMESSAIGYSRLTNVSAMAPQLFGKRF